MPATAETTHSKLPESPELSRLLEAVQDPSQARQVAALARAVGLDPGQQKGVVDRVRLLLVAHGHPTVDALVLDPEVDDDGYCRVLDCGEKGWTRGLCQRHYDRARVVGMLEALALPAKGVGNRRPRKATGSAKAASKAPAAPKAGEEKAGEKKGRPELEVVSKRAYEERTRQGHEEIERLRARVAELESADVAREKFWQEILEAKNAKIERLERKLAAVEAERDADREIAERTIARLNGLAVDAQPEGGLEHAAVRVMHERDALAKQVGTPGGNGHLHDEIRDLRGRLEQAERERDAGLEMIGEAHGVIDVLVGGVLPAGTLEYRLRCLDSVLTRPVKQAAANDVAGALARARDLAMEAVEKLDRRAPHAAAYRLGQLVDLASQALAGGVARG